MWTRFTGAAAAAAPASGAAAVPVIEVLEETMGGEGSSSTSPDQAFVAASANERTVAGGGESQNAATATAAVYAAAAADDSATVTSDLWDTLEWPETPPSDFESDAGSAEDDVAAAMVAGGSDGDDDNNDSENGPIVARLVRLPESGPLPTPPAPPAAPLRQGSYCSVIYLGNDDFATVVFPEITTEKAKNDLKRTIAQIRSEFLASPLRLTSCLGHTVKQFQSTVIFNFDWLIL